MPVVNNELDSDVPHAASKEISRIVFIGLHLAISGLKE
jgi:hypothetical protein